MTGESLTEAIRIALEERLARQRRPERRYPMRAAAHRLRERLATLPVVDPSARTTLEHDEYGLPT